VATLIDSTSTRSTLPPLRAVRKAQGLSLARVSELSGVDIGHLSRIERGQAGLSIETLARLAKVLGLRELERMLEQYRPTQSESPPGRAQGSRKGTSNGEGYP
jgi:transcriptional regulator with XRE-family HTH domain